jgi:N-sulfoglucosamine sulfohydrolase
MVNYTDAHRLFIKQSEGFPEDPFDPGDIEVLPEIGFETASVRQQVTDYYNCMMRLDTGIGMLLNRLDEAGRKSNTVVIYLGDHGQDILRGKRTSYEGGN